MDGPPIRKDVLLWQVGDVRCTCWVISADHIQIAVTVDGVVVREDWFSDYHEAGEFAADLIHRYEKP
ncbi:MAG: hypothetical protein JWL71_1272 [Acidobacteria bacterium]|jgi:hypothetical protein|nr:hypothetical protein [Acidobacteriota bacterium]